MGGTGLVILLLAWPAALAVMLTYRLAVPDNRLRAQEWIYEHVPRGSHIWLLNPYNVPVDPLDYHTSQTYGGESTAAGVEVTQADIIVYSDSYAFVAFRDRNTLQHYPATIANEQAIISALETFWVELARFERWPWPAENFSPDDVSYWHQMEIVIYCHPARCAVLGR